MENIIVFVLVILVLCGFAYMANKKSPSEEKEIVKDSVYYLKKIHFWIVFWSILSIVGGVIYLLFFIGASLD